MPSDSHKNSRPKKSLIPPLPPLPPRPSGNRPADTPGAPGRHPRRTAPVAPAQPERTAPHQTQQPARPPPGGEPAPVIGLLEVPQNGAAHLRSDNFDARNDPIVPIALIRSLDLRPGDQIAGVATPGQNGAVVQSVQRVNGHPLDSLATRPRFENFTAVHPNRAIVLGYKPDAWTGRVLDLIAPVGRGQRGLIVAPPKAGKTTVLKEIANGVIANPALRLLICLVGERPEEVTELRRDVHAEILAADLDAPPAVHARLATVGMERARRLAEEGYHVVLLVDSLTRLARAHNLGARGGGRTLSGGMDAAALQPARTVFGSARATEIGGSITVLATCLVDTGSRLDDLVYEEFKSTGNMEVHLSRELSEQRIFPAIDLLRSGTRREELLLDTTTLQQVARLRRRIAQMSPAEALELVLDALRKTETNAQALAMLT